MYQLRSHVGKLRLVKDGKAIATFRNPANLDLANEICNILNVEQQKALAAFNDSGSALSKTVSKVLETEFTGTMFKVLDPTDGAIIGVYETKEEIPNKLPNRFESYWFPRSHCDIVEVTDPKDRARLQKSLDFYKSINPKRNK